MATGYVNIKGRGLKFCQGSIAELQGKIQSCYKGLTPETPDEEKKGIEEKAAKIIQAYSGYWLVHYGLEANCIIKGQEVEFTMEDTVNWFDDLTKDELKEIIDCYKSTQEFLKDIPKPAKKKTVKKRGIKLKR